MLAEYSGDVDMSIKLERLSDLVCSCTCDTCANGCDGYQEHDCGTVNRIGGLIPRSEHIELVHIRYDGSYCGDDCWQCQLRNRRK